MQKALSISRDQILNVKVDTLNIPQCETPIENNINKVMSFVTQFNSHTSIFRNFFNDNSNELNSIIGEHQIIMANRKNPNLGDVLFSGKKFAKSLIQSGPHAPCSARCMTCPRLSPLPKKVTLEDRTYTLQECCCKTDDAIYVCICELCNDFYIGQTIDPLNIRMNGHRTHFNDGKPELSALAYHITVDHPDMVSYKLNNYIIGLLAKCNPLNLTRRESRFIVDTKADTKHLNRYKP